MQRRFFPSQRVQQVPGRVTDVEVQIRPGGTADCACNTPGPALLIDHVLRPDYYEYVPDKYASSVDAGTPSIMEPVFQGWRLVDGSVYIPWPWGNKNAHVRAIVPGVDVHDVRWTWELDVPDLPTLYEYESWWDGVQIAEQDGTLSVLILAGDPGTWWWEIEQWSATLTLTAYCSGKDVGSVIVRPRFSPELN